MGIPELGKGRAAVEDATAGRAAVEVDNAGDVGVLAADGLQRK